MKKIIIFISLQTYLRNWIDAGAFNEIQKKHNVLFVIPEYDWEPKEIENYGISNYCVVKQSEWRKFLFRRMLLITMVRYSNRSMAFKIKTQNFSGGMKYLHYLISKNIFYQLFMFLCKKILGIWPELNQTIKSFNPDLIIAPSLAADSFTIDLTLTANIKKIKSIILINSWDNLVSKGVIPIQPSYLGLWGHQSIKHAVEVQKMPKNKLIILGVPRFESYFEKIKISDKIHRFNNIPPSKKIILYAATVMPFDDISALKLLNDELVKNPDYKDYVILFRAHPEMMSRVDEVNLDDCNFEKVFLDKHTSNFYRARFNGTAKPSTINETSLDYYPTLLKNIVCIVGPPTTLTLEGLINGKPCLMICYNDGRNHHLSPEKMSKFENVREVLSLEGVYPCYQEAELLKNFKKVISSSSDDKLSKKIIQATDRFVYTDRLTYSKRLYNFTENIFKKNRPFK